MLETRKDFSHRLDVLGRKHAAMSNGYTTKLRADGLIVVTPRRKRTGVPLRGLVLALAVFFVFKAFAVISLGDVTYSERVAKLRSGTAAEQVGAWAMQIDPVTLTLVQIYADLSS